LHRGLIALATALVLFSQEAPAHDPDTYGGTFRTHDAGATWTSINPGAFPSGVLAVAVNPRDPNHLLLATDSGLWRSRNGGRDWDVEGPETLTGPAFAAAFDADGRRALVAGTSTLFRDDGNRWRPVPTPAGASPARALVAGALPGCVYLAGRAGLYRSDDWGESWTNVGRALEADRVDALLVLPGRSDHLYAVVAGSVWSSNDGARSWQRRSSGNPGKAIEAVGFDPAAPTPLWAVAAGQVYRSDQPDGEWRTVGKPVDETSALARAIAISGAVIVIATDRGVFRSANGGERWELPKESLPAHVAARVLVGDSRNPATLYAGFALTGYEELQQLARRSETASWRSDLGSVGGFGLVVLIALGVIAAAARRVGRLRAKFP
jgi:photosystem II stability/assembly factor-like uncharacterized protein